MHYKDKVVFWEDLLKLHKDLRGKNISYCWDFHTTKSQLDKWGGTKVGDPFGEKMEDLVSYLDLLDIPLRNRKYT